MTNEAGLDLAHALGAVAHAHREAHHAAVNDLVLDDRVAEHRDPFERTANGRVVEVIPVPHVLEERRLEAGRLGDPAPDSERGEEPDHGSADVDRGEAPLRERRGGDRRGDVTERGSEEARQRVVMDPGQVQHSAEHR